MKAVFLDRDGVINEYPGDKEYVTSWGKFHFLDTVKDSLKKLSDNGFKIFIISNQAGVAKGLYSQGALDIITENMLKVLSGFGINIAGVYYCTHRSEDNCACRKPKTGLVEKAIAQLKAASGDIDRQNSFFIGDTILDVDTGKKSGLKTILVFSGKEKPENKDNWLTPPDFTAQDLAEAVKLIVKE